MLNDIAKELGWWTYQNLRNNQRKMDIIEEKKKKRLLLLGEFYDKSGGNSQQKFKPLSLENYEEAILFYLMEEDLVSKAEILWKGSPLEYSITHKGVKEIERARNNPNESTTYFPPMNVINNTINIKQVSNSAIQQGTHTSSQTFSLMSENSEKIKEVVDELNKVKEKLENDIEKREEIESLVSTIQAQVDTPKLNYNILNYALSDAKNFLLGLNVNLYTPTVIDTIGSLIK